MASPVISPSVRTLSTGLTTFSPVSELIILNTSGSALFSASLNFQPVNFSATRLISSILPVLSHVITPSPMEWMVTASLSFSFKISCVDFFLSSSISLAYSAILSSSAKWIKSRLTGSSAVTALSKNKTKRLKSFLSLRVIILRKKRKKQTMADIKRKK